MIVTTILKKMGNRPRPVNPRDDKTNQQAWRSLNLRAKEGNKSMPSADTAQSALCAAYISLMFPDFFQSIGGIHA